MEGDPQVKAQRKAKYRAMTQKCHRQRQKKRRF